MSKKKTRRKLPPIGEGYKKPTSKISAKEIERIPNSQVAAMRGFDWVPFDRPVEPTTAPPGSDERIAVYRQRHEDGVDIFHEQDVEKTKKVTTKKKVNPTRIVFK